MNEREDIVRDILEIMKERHSVRQYKNQAIEPSKREEISSLIMMSMRRVDYPFRLFRRTENVKNYIAIVGNKNDQEKAGYYGEKIVLKCPELGKAD